MFGVAIVTYVIRTYIRLRVMKRFLADDYLLLFAVIVLIGVTALAFAAIGHQYDLLTVILHGAEPALLFSVLNEIPVTSKVRGNTPSSVYRRHLPKHRRKKMRHLPCGGL